MTKFLLRISLFALALSFFAMGCKDDEEPKPSGVVASFQFEVNATKFNKVQFTNFSQNYASLAWDFDDGSTSTETNPLHTFAAAGTYSVKLKATGSDKVVSEKVLDVIISDPNLELKKLTGETSKTWKLLRDVTGGKYPLQVGPSDHSAIWWASGLNEEIGVRPCLFNDEFIFTFDGKKFQYKTNGDLWKDGDVWSSTGCADTSDPATFVNKNGADVSAWGDGLHTFDYNVQDKKLNLIGTGAFVGLCKVGSTDGVLVPQASTLYSVVKLVDDVVDTLVVEATFPNNGTPGYWRFVLVHYDNPALEPTIPGPKPIVGFDVVRNDKTVTITNNSSNATYAWNFGDGSTSTETNPQHTYATNDFYTITLTATNVSGSATATRNVFISDEHLTEAQLNGGGSKTWKLKAVAGSFGVGPGKGSDAYWPNGADISGDRPCLFNDEFIFKTGSVYQYDAKGDIFAETYMGIAAGCTDEVNLTGDGAIWKSGNHTYTFAPAAGANRETITVGGLGAFIALPKAHNGGEYATPPTADAPVTYEVVAYAKNGAKETMQIAVDVGGGTFWSFILSTQ